ncbi:hypothetical protein [Lacticaseibacillus nasuensis]|uniref:hypothetical protein n=1 Tax=Lacticaseibacillus nasuensis TaxID=944671 RepID=UPI0006CF4523|nr:hypothetical protein [Lacticaseibacillus nasuensis]
MAQEVFHGDVSAILKTVARGAQVNPAAHDEVTPLELLVWQYNDVWETQEEMVTIPNPNDLMYCRVAPWFLQLLPNFEEGVSLTGRFFTIPFVPSAALGRVQTALDQFHRQLANQSRDWSKNYHGQLKQQFEAATKLVTSQQGSFTQIQLTQLNLVKQSDKERLAAFDRRQAQQREWREAAIGVVDQATRWVWFFDQVTDANFDDSGDGIPDLDMVPHSEADYRDQATMRALYEKWLKINRAAAQRNLNK